MKKRILIVAIVSCLTILSAAWAVVPISGIVTTSMGEPIPGATITISPTAGGTPMTFTTGLDGRFQIPKVPEGKCNCTVTAKGFKTAQSLALCEAGAHIQATLIETEAQGSSTIEGNSFAGIQDFPLSGAPGQAGSDGGQE